MTSLSPTGEFAARSDNDQERMADGRSRSQDDGRGCDDPGLTEQPLERSATLDQTLAQRTNPAPGSDYGLTPMERRRRGLPQDEPVPGGDIDAANLSQGELAGILARVVLDDFVYTRGVGWLRYRDSAWRPVGPETVVELLRRWAVASHQRAARELDQIPFDEGDEDEHVLQERERRRGTLKAKYKKGVSVASKTPLEQLAALCKGILVRPLDDFDADPEIAVALNGANISRACGQSGQHGAHCRRVPPCATRLRWAPRRQ